MVTGAKNVELAASETDKQAARDAAVVEVERLMSGAGVKDTGELGKAKDIYENALVFIINTGFYPPSDDPDKY